MAINEENNEEEYVSFIISLMVDIESYIQRYEILQASGLFVDLIRVMKSLGGINELKLLTEDESLIIYLLKTVSRLTSTEHPSLRNIKMCFMRLVDLILRVLLHKYFFQSKKGDIHYF